MKQNEIELLVNLRNYLIHKYESLDGRSNPGAAVMLQKDVASMLEESVRRIDVLLADHVKIGK